MSALCLSEVAAAVPLLSPVVLVEGMDHHGTQVRFLLSASPKLKEKEETRKEEEEKREELLEKRMVALNRWVVDDLSMTPAECAAWSQWVSAPEIEEEEEKEKRKKCLLRSRRIYGRTRRPDDARSDDSRANPDCETLAGASPQQALCSATVR